MENTETGVANDQLLAKFRAFQAIVDATALNRRASKRKAAQIRLDASTFILREYGGWQDDAWRLEFSPEFCELASIFEFIHLLYERQRAAKSHDAVDKNQTELLRSLIQQFTKLATPDWRDLDQSEEDSFPPTAIGTWCRLSGFFYCKLSTTDLTDWGPHFEELLSTIRHDAGMMQYMLGIGYLPDYVKLKSVDLRRLSKDEFEKIRWCHQFGLQPKSDICEVELDHFGAKHLTLNTPYISKRIVGRERPASETEDVFRHERRVFQLTSLYKADFQFVSCHSCTLTSDDTEVRIFEINHDGMTTFAKDFNLRVEYLFRDFPDATESPPAQRAWFGPLFDCLYQISTGGLLAKFGLDTAVDLFDKASLSNDRAIEYLTCIATLESALVDRPGQFTGDLISHRYAKLVSGMVDERHNIITLLQNSYKHRNKMVHGENPDLLREPYAAVVDPAVIRGICRRTLLTLIFVLERLRLDELSDFKSALYDFLAKHGRPVPHNRKMLCSSMSEFEQDTEFWQAVYLTACAYAARIGFPIETFFPES